MSIVDVRALGVVALAVVGLVLSGTLGRAGGVAFAGMFRLLLRVAGWVLFGVALAVKYAATHPRSIPPFAVTAIIGWVAWPYLGDLSGGWVILLGLVGAAVAGTVFTVAVRDQHRLGRDLRVPYTTDGPTRPVGTGHWSDEYR